jgi:glycine/D-amino acid oxidase-like deaminating enzyme
MKTTPPGQPADRRSFLKLLAGAAATAAAGKAAARVAGPAPHVGVVGAGIIGASIAYHLAEAGARVTVFDKAGPAAGATRNSFAWINAFVDDAHYRDLRLASLLAWHGLDRRLSVGIVWGGYLNWATDAAGAELVRANAAQLAGSPYPTQSLSLADVARLSPHLQPGPVIAALYSAIDGHLDPVHATQCLLDGARGHGAVLRYPCAVRSVEFRGGHVAGVRTDQGHVALDALIVATGVDAPALLAPCGYALKLHHAPGILAHSKPLAPLTHIIHDGPGTLSFKQMADGRLVGTDSPDPPDLPVHAQIRLEATDFPDPAIRAMHGQRILGKIAAILPDARGAELEWLSLGFRPMPADERPIVGEVPGVRGLYMSVTHSGITLAPILGRYMAAEVLDGVRAPALATYRPDRFGPSPG